MRVSLTCLEMSPVVGRTGLEGDAKRQLWKKPCPPVYATLPPKIGGRLDDESGQWAVAIGIPYVKI